MKKICLILALIFVFSTFVGCNKVDVLFEFSCKTEKNAFFPGETVNIVAKVKNISDATYEYIGSPDDFAPNAELFSAVTNKKLEFIPTVSDGTVEQECEVEPGKESTKEYKFLIPEDAKTGKYTLRLYFGEQEKFFSEIITVYNKSKSQKNEKLFYTSTLISSGEYAITPIECMVWAHQYKNGELAITGDGFGIDGIFKDSEISDKDFPTIELNTEIKANLTLGRTANTRLKIYDTSYQKSEHDFTSWKELSKLEPGEYIVVYDEYSDTRKGDNDIKDYWENYYECAFKLVVK